MAFQALKAKLLSPTDQDSEADDIERYESVEEFIPGRPMGLPRPLPLNEEEYRPQEAAALRVWIHRLTKLYVLVVLVLGLCGIEWVVEKIILDQATFPGWIGWMLFPLHAVAGVTYWIIMILPVACAFLLHIFRSLELPRGDCQAAQKITSWMKWHIAVCLIIIYWLAWKTYVLAGYAALIYFPFIVVFIAYWVFTRPFIWRMWRTYSVSIPMLVRYKLLYRWCLYNNIPEEDQESAYTKLHRKYAPLIYERAVELGGVCVKTGQRMTCLPVLPKEYMHELKKLQASVPPRPGEVVKKLITDALHQPIHNIFREFDDIPLGSASIGQVHRAELAHTHQEVVVKVQYPEIAMNMKTDFRNLEFVAWLQGPRELAVIQKFKETFLEELDFFREARNLQRVHDNLKETFPKVSTPVPIRDLCTSKVLVMTRVQGTSLLDAVERMIDALARACGMGHMSIDDLKEKLLTDNTSDTVVNNKNEWRSLKRAVAAVAVIDMLPEAAKRKVVRGASSAVRRSVNLGIALYNQSAGNLGAAKMKIVPKFNAIKISETLWRVYGHQVLVVGFFSSDPHPGNILIDEKTGNLGLIDFGQAIELSMETRVNLARAVVAVKKGSDSDMARCQAQLGIRLDRAGKHTTKLLAMHAQFCWGKHFSWEAFENMREFMREDNCDFTYDDEIIPQVLQAIGMLRGAGMALATFKIHHPASLWLDIAERVISEKGNKFPPKQSAAFKAHLDSQHTGNKSIHRSPSLPASWSTGSIFYDIDEDPEEESKFEG